MQEKTKSKIKIGCCGFPESKERYFQEFTVVEIQQTFYQPPKLETLQKWRQLAPESFEFTLKAWQLITHLPSSPTYRRLTDTVPEVKKSVYGFFKPTDEVFAAWEQTLQCAIALKATKIIFQCPASFQQNDINIQNMGHFFQHIDRTGLALLWEPRGNWQNETIKSICENLNLVHCVDPFVNLAQAGLFEYFRLHGIGGYRYQYTHQDRERLVQFCQGEQQVYCMFNNVNMLQDARLFLKSLKSE